MKRGKKLIPPVLISFLGGLISAGFSAFLKSNYQLTPPLAILLLEASVIVLATVLVWFLLFEFFQWQKRVLRLIMLASLAAFIVISACLSTFGNNHRVTIHSNGTDKTYFVGNYDRNHQRISTKEEHVKHLESFELDPSEAYEDLEETKRKLTRLGALLIFVMTSLLALVVQYTGIDLTSSPEEKESKIDGAQESKGFSSEEVSE